MVVAADAGNERAENPFKRSPDPCTNPIDMRTTFHGQLNFPSSFVISFPSTSQTLSRDTLLAAISVTEHAGVTDTSWLRPPAALLVEMEHFHPGWDRDKITPLNAKLKPCETA